MPGKLSSETHQTLCASKLSERGNPQNNDYVQKKIPRAAHQPLHLQHKSSGPISGVLQLIFFMLNKTGGGILKNMLKKYTWERAQGKASLCLLWLNSKKADDTQKEYSLLLQEVSQHLHGKMSTTPVLEKKWGKSFNKRPFLRHSSSHWDPTEPTAGAEDQHNIILNTGRKSKLGWLSDQKVRRRQKWGFACNQWKKQEHHTSCPLTAPTKHLFLSFGHRKSQREYFIRRYLHWRKKNVVSWLTLLCFSLCCSIWQHCPTFSSEDYHQAELMMSLQIWGVLLSIIHTDLCHLMEVFLICSTTIILSMK